MAATCLWHFEFKHHRVLQDSWNHWIHLLPQGGIVERPTSKARSSMYDHNTHCHWHAWVHVHNGVKWTPVELTSSTDEWTLHREPSQHDKHECAIGSVTEIGACSVTYGVLLTMVMLHATRGRVGLLKLDFFPANNAWLLYVRSSTIENSNTKIIGCT